MTYCKRIFILLCLFTLTFAYRQSPSDQDQPLYYSIYAVFNNLGKMTGLGQNWNLLSYENKIYQKMFFSATQVDGKGLPIDLLFNNQSAVFPDFFFKFREEEYILKILDNTEALESYLNYQCKNQDASLIAIQLQFEPFRIRSPKEARESNQFFDPLTSYLRLEKKCQLL